MGIGETPEINYKQVPWRSLLDHLCRHLNLVHVVKMCGLNYDLRVLWHRRCRPERSQNFECHMTQIAIEDFTLARARELDVVFVSVSGDFSKEWCEKMSEGCVCPPAVV